MRIFMRAVFIMLLATSSCLAQENPIRQLFQSILTQPAAMPSTEQLFSTVNETTVGALPASEVAAILPLARQCLQSANNVVRQDGLILLIAVVTRPDSAKVLEPYIDDLGALLSGPEGAISLRHGALYVLGSLKPTLPPKAIAHLNAHLEESRNSDEETLTIAASLLDSAPTDAAIVHKTLLVVSQRPDPGLTGGVLRQLGLNKTRVPEALDFIGRNLNHADPNVRASAVDAASRLDRDVRKQFTAQLSRILSDPSESEYMRSQARLALQP